MKRIIAIVAGGDSSEHEVSLRSAQGIYSFIDKNKYACYIIIITGTRWEAMLSDGSKTPVDKNDFSFETPDGRVRPDFAYITIHGTPGENGILQGYFDLIRLPYSTSGVLVEALTFNKFSLNQYLKAWGVRVAESVLLRKGQEDAVSDEDIIEKVGLPCFVKPNADGSSFGVTKVKTKDQLRPAIEKAMGEGSETMIETFISGTEVTCGCYKTKNRQRIFPITEVVTEQEFFDYEAKYINDSSELYIPARITESKANEVRFEAINVYKALGCSGLSRVDFFVENDSGEVLLNEVNTIPGFTSISMYPKLFGASGIEYGELIDRLFCCAVDKWEK